MINVIICDDNEKDRNNFKRMVKAFMDKSLSLSDITPKISLKENLKAPIKKGENLGTVTYEIEGITYTSNLVANSDVEKVSYFLIIFRVILIIVLLFIFCKILVYTKKKAGKRVKGKNYRL